VGHPVDAYFLTITKFASLVNNVGMGYDHPDFYLHYEEKVCFKIIV